MNAFDDADSRCSMGAVHAPSKAWKAAAEAAEHAESVAKDNSAAAEQAHAKATHEATKSTKRTAI